MTLIRGAGMLLLFVACQGCRESPPAAGPVSQKALTLAERQEIYAAIASGEREATKPWVGQPGMYPPERDTALKAAQSAIREKYQISSEQYWKIVSEGSAAYWPESRTP